MAGKMERLSGWTLFRLRGVDVKIHVSLLFLLFYVILTATASFPLVVRESGVNMPELSGDPVLWATAFAVALVLSIFVHEFSHVIVAQSKGVKVRQITLMMLGGAAQMEKIPEEPMSEFKVAIIGPLVSLAIAALLFWVRSISNSTEIIFFSYWVGRTNLVLAIFNLLPAFPTDGGRVLRAFLVSRLGRLRGTELAVKVSSVFAWAFGILGFIYFNFLLVLIAVFIYGAAKSELMVLWGQTVLKGLKVRDIYQRVPVLEPDVSLTEAAKVMAGAKQLLLPVNIPGTAPAVISADMMNRFPKNMWEQTSVGPLSVRSSKPVSIDDDLDDVWQTLLAFPAGGVAVLEGDHIAGIIQLSDIMKTFELQRLSGAYKTPAVFEWNAKKPLPKPT